MTAIHPDVCGTLKSDRMPSVGGRVAGPCILVLFCVEGVAGKTSQGAKISLRFNNEIVSSVKSTWREGGRLVIPTLSEDKATMGVWI